MNIIVSFLTVVKYSQRNKKSNFERHCNTKPRECAICTEIFCTLKQLQQHHKSEHPKFQCNKCDQSFTLLSDLNRHLEGNVKGAELQKAHSRINVMFAIKFVVRS